MIKAFVNNTEVILSDAALVTEAIEKSGFAGHIIAVAINGEFVAKSQYSHVTIKQNDNIDIVKPIGGG